MPEPAPLAMGAQDLGRSPAARPLVAEPGLALRRGALLAGVVLLAAVAGGLTLDVLSSGGITFAEGLLAGLTVVLSGWIGFGFLTALAGFVLALGTRATDAPPPSPQPRGRTAILAPAYNEDPGLMLPNIQAMAEDLDRLGVGEHYDIHILSDTRDDAIAHAETAGFHRLRARLGPGAPRLHYRRRARNTDRKAGNVADWVRGFGSAYDYMLVLDADSLMTGECILALTAEMDADPRLGLLQTSPMIVKAETPFARLQQFATRLYGPICALGQHWWSGSEGNFWGHNAIIRVTAFAESAGLPHLPGPRPFGGHILSHDFVEAALLRRRGWAVRMAPGLVGSYETAPPTLLDQAVRDRRWCQGNLQHLPIIAAAGLHWVSRLHLLRGVLTYLAPVLWLAQLACSAATPEVGQGFAAGAEAKLVALFALVTALLFGPKVIAYALVLRDARLRRGFGGARRLTAGLMAEIAFSGLAAPVLMLMQTAAVLQVLAGKDSGWAAQRREGAALTARDAWRAHRLHVAVGVVGAATAFLVNPGFLLWTSPVFLALSLSALFSLHTSRAPSARMRRRLLQIPEEAEPPPVLARSIALRRAHAESAGLRRQIDRLFSNPVAPLRPAADAQPDPIAA